MNKPEVTIIIPTYNREDLILKALDSVFNQTFHDYEIFVVDDASTDSTGEVIAKLNHPKVFYFKLDQNGGQCIARNYGIRRAKGKYIAFLDSDDEWLPTKLERQLELFKNGSDRLGAVYGYSFQKDMKKDETILSDSGYYRGDIHEKLLKGFCPPTPSLFLVRKAALDSVDGFDEELVTFVDLDLWMRIGEKYDFDYVEEPVIIKYEHIGADQYVTNFEKRYRGIRLFFHKWSPYMISKGGRKGLMAFKRGLVYKMIFPFLDHPPEKLRAYIPRIFRLLIEIRSTRMRYYFKSLLVLILGPRIIYRIRSVR